MGSDLERLQQFFTSRGFSHSTIDMLQPADPFLDTAGEDLRRRIFMTSDLDGRSLCLRPEFTIPVCLAHLADDQTEASHAYGGSVFRQRRNGPAEFLQAGVELIGGERTVQKDVECIKTAFDALACCGVGHAQMIFGDQLVFEALLKALALPDAWAMRLLRAFGDEDRLKADLELFSNGDNGDNGDYGDNGDNGHSANLEPELANALKRSDRNEVERLISAKMAQANLPASGGRTAQHIAARLMTKTELATSRMSREQHDILRAFLRIEVPLAAASTTLVEFSASTGLDINGAIDVFCRRADLLAQCDISNATISWRASFGRRLDYYTGIAFEIFQEGETMPVCGGGRYDHLMGMLGAGEEIPAVGFSIWLDRLAGELS